MKRTISLMLILAMCCCLLAGCGKGSSAGSISGSDYNCSLDSVIDPDSCINPLTGEAASKGDFDPDSRPYCVMINNVPDARPSMGLSNASMIYECIVEGGITRLMAVFNDLSGIDVGYVRSARSYYASLCKSYDGVYVHWGSSGSTTENNAEFCKANGIPDMDANVGAFAGQRNQARIDAGKAIEHTAYFHGSDAVSAAENNGYTEHASGYDTTYGLLFSVEAAKQCTSSAKDFTVLYSGNSACNFSTNFAYDEGSGLYKVSMNKGGSDYSEYIDEAGGSIRFKNVIVLSVNVNDTNDDKGHVAMNFVGSGTGYFCCGGNCVEINWSRDSISSPFHYTLADGSNLALGVGKTYVSVCDLSGRSSISWNA